LRFFYYTATSDLYTLSLHDALPILSLVPEDLLKAAKMDGASAWQRFVQVTLPLMKPAILVALLFRTLDAFRIFDNIYILTAGGKDRKSTRLNSSHEWISYAVFCLKK